MKHILITCAAVLFFNLLTLFCINFLYGMPRSYVL